MQFTYKEDPKSSIYLRKTNLTDFALALGLDQKSKYFDNSFINSDTYYNTSLYDKGSDKYYVMLSGFKPIMNFSDSEVSLKKFSNEFEYGFFPKNVALKGISFYLDGLAKKKSGNSFLVPSKSINQFDELDEYCYFNDRYVSMTLNTQREYVILSDGEKHYNGDKLWFSVEPIIWIADKKKKLATPKDLIVAGFNYVPEKNNNDSSVEGYFENYLNYFGNNIKRMIK